MMLATPSPPSERAPLILALKFAAKNRGARLF